MSDVHPGSKALFERATKVLPGGNTRTTLYHKPYPIYAASGSGFTVTDVDGNQHTDFLNNYTALIHGHLHPRIISAVEAQLKLGTAFANPTETEVVLAEMLCERVPSFDLVRFCNSGSEAVMNAVKAAQAYTNRPKLVKAEGAYHGSYTPVEVSLGSTPDNWGEDTPNSVPYSRGTPQSVLNDVIVIPYNDVAATERILTPHAQDIAAILLDPMPNRAGMIPGTPEFLGFCRKFCDEHGIVLIFDEVITFRVESAGLQGKLGIQPDLTTLAKIIGGGFPVGAVAGKQEVMEVFDSRSGNPALPQGGTYNANPITMVAGIAAMEMLDEGTFQRLATLGEKARESLRQAFRLAEMPGQVTGDGSLFNIHFKDKPLTDFRSARKSPQDAARLAHLHHFLLDNGIIISPTGLGSISTPMGEAQVDELAEKVLAGLKDIRNAERASA